MNDLEKGGNEPVKSEDKNLLARLGQQIAELPKEQRQHLEGLIGQLAQVETTMVSAFSGPLPPPEALAEYEKVCPGLAERIVVMAEREQRIREKGQDDYIPLKRAALTNERIKIFGAAFVSTVLFSVAGLATYLGNPIIAVPLGLAGFGSALLQFILRWSGRTK